jgi:pectinesterase
MISKWKRALELEPATWPGVITALFMTVGISVLRADQPPIIVATDGSGHFKTVQSAIDSIPDKNTDPRVILIKPGTYRERILISESKTFITLRGDHKDAGQTVLTFNRYWGMDDPEAPGKKVESDDVQSVLIRADNFTAENITFENSAGEVGQAPAVRTRSDKQSFRNCRFLGWQDTLYVDGKRAYFKDCYVEGRVDFIFGRATAVFENCHLHSKKGGYVAAASTDPKTPFGLVFLQCKLTGRSTDKTYLGRPWKEGAATAFIGCELGGHVRPEGWAQWSGSENHKTARFVEYKNTGPGANPSQRPSWTRQLSDAEARTYTIENVLGGEDRWNPRK